MPDQPTTPSPSPAFQPPPDVSLLLRTHAEQRWLAREVIPMLRHVETRERQPDEPLDAPLAYLEALWLEAERRAGETDATRRLLDCPSEGDRPEDRALYSKACRYYDSVRALREVVAKRMARLPVVAPDPAAAPMAADTHTSKPA